MNINRPETISNGNYLFRYYFTKNNDKFEYKLNKTYNKKKINYKDNKADKADICLEFNRLEIYHNGKLVNNSEFNIKETNIENNINSGIKLKIFGSLFKKENTNNDVNELLNTSAFISSIPSYENNIEINYSDNNKFELCFMNMNKTDFIFDLRIKINVIFNEYYFKEDFLAYALPIELKDELKKEDDSFEKYLDNNKILLIAILIVIVIMVIFIILYIKMRRRNRNLESQVLSISLTSGNSEDLFSEYSKGKKTDPDYDNTFI